MNITKKYNFKVSLDQFGCNVSEDWFDKSEIMSNYEYELIFNEQKKSLARIVY